MPSQGVVNDIDCTPESGEFRSRWRWHRRRGSRWSSEYPKITHSQYSRPLHLYSRSSHRSLPPRPFQTKTLSKYSIPKTTSQKSSTLPFHNPRSAPKSQHNYDYKQIYNTAISKRGLRRYSFPSAIHINPYSFCWDIIPTAAEFSRDGDSEPD